MRRFFLDILTILFALSDHIIYDIISVMCHCSPSDHARKLRNPLRTISPSCLQDVLVALGYVLTKNTDKTRLYTDRKGEQIMVSLPDDGQIHQKYKFKIRGLLSDHDHEEELRSLAR